MPPAASVAENILANIKTTLQAIAPSGVPATGYSTAIKQVLRWGKDPSSINEYPILVFGDVSEKVDKGSNQLLHKTMTVVLTAYMELPFETDDATGGSITALKADIEKVLMQDPSRGGYAVDTLHKGSEVDVAFEAGPFLRFTMMFDVQYRQNRTDPTNPCAS